VAAFTGMDNAQRDAARAKAIEMRRKRAELRKSLKTGEESPLKVMARGDDDVIGGMRVGRFLTALPGIGQARADQIAGKLRIDPKWRIRRLTRVQRFQLIGYLGPGKPARIMETRDGRKVRNYWGKPREPQQRAAEILQARQFLRDAERRYKARERARARREEQQTEYTWKAPRIPVQRKSGKQALRVGKPEEKTVTELAANVIAPILVPAQFKSTQRVPRNNDCYYCHGHARYKIRFARNRGMRKVCDRCRMTAVYDGGVIL
jgi:hypothetical protein